MIRSLTSERAYNALDLLQNTKKPSDFIDSSILLGGELALLMREQAGIPSSESFPIFYKLRDGRYAVLGYKRVFHDAKYYPIYTNRYGPSFSNVNVKPLSADFQISEELMNFLDPMVSRGTTLSSMVSRICGEKRVGLLGSAHFFVAEEGIRNLQTNIEQYCGDYLMIIGKRGFQVNSQGYMGAIRREQDYGDVLEGTYFEEYPMEVEQDSVVSEIANGSEMEIHMGQILFLLLRTEHARFPNGQLIPESMKAVSTGAWIQNALLWLKQKGANVPADDWSMSYDVPRSEMIREALGQLQLEWRVETRSVRKGPKTLTRYIITPFGNAYLKKVYLPVFDRQGILKPFTTTLESELSRLVRKSFSRLIEEVKYTQRTSQED